MNIYLFLVIAPVLIVNLWHIYLVTSYHGDKRLVTISEHAVTTRSRLYMHRVIHALPLIFFLPFALWFLVPNDFRLAAILLIASAILEIKQAVSLNKYNAPLDSGVNKHSVKAWMMAVCYLAYTLVLGLISDISLFIFLPLFTVCLVLVSFAALGLHRNRTLFMQMSFFIVLSLLGILGHISLIL